MNAGDIMAQVRLAAEDTTKTRYSDWGVMESINKVVRIIAEYDKNAMFRKRAVLILTNGSVSLPDDYVAAKRCFDSDGKEILRTWTKPLDERGYFIDGSKLYSGESSVTMAYAYCPSPITSPAGTIDMQLSLLRPLALFACGMLSGNKTMLADGYAFFTGKQLTSRDVGQEG